MKTYIQINEDGNVSGIPEVRDIASWDDVAKNRNGGYVLREYVDVPPSYSSSLERLEQLGYTIDDTTVTVNYMIVSRSNAEIATNNFNAAIEAGYDTGKGFKLRLFDADRSAFTEFTTLLDKALLYGQATTSSLFPIKDYNDNLVYLSASQYYPIALGYGMYYTNLWALKASASKA